jgi:hypothetical protein
LLQILKSKSLKTPEWESEYNYIISTKNTNLSENEKKLYAMLDPIKNFYNYSEENWVKLDLKKDSDIFENELNNLKKTENKKLNNTKKTRTLTEDKKENLVEISEEKYLYNEEYWVITINTWNEIETIKVTSNDKKILNEENIDNYIEIHRTFTKLWLTNIIPYLSQISSAIWNNWKTINYNDDFLKENELKQVLNSILVSTWYEDIDEKKDLDEFINIFSNYKNKKQYWWYKDNFYKIWNSTIEEKFLEKFVNNKVKFETELFKKLIKTQKNPT